MTLLHRAHVGHEVLCDALDCTATVLPHGPRTVEAAAAAAVDRTWLEVRIGGQLSWICPIHQTYDTRLGRWVAIPLITERRSPRARHAS